MPTEEGHYTKDEVQEMIRQRLAAKDATIATLTSERDEAVRKATTADVRIQKAEATALQAAFKMAGVSEDATIRRGFELFYNEAMANVPEVDRPSLADWVASDAAKNHPMLKTHFAGEGGAPAAPPAEGGDDPPADPAAPADPAPAGGGAPPTPPPNGNAGADNPPTKNEPMTAEQLRAYLRSDEYRALGPKEQRERYNALKAEMGHGDVFNGQTQVQSVLPTPPAQQAS